MSTPKSTASEGQTHIDNYKKFMANTEEECLAIVSNIIACLYPYFLRGNIILFQLKQLVGKSESEAIELEKKKWELMSSMMFQRKWLKLLIKQQNKLLSGTQQ